MRAGKAGGPTSRRGLHQVRSNRFTQVKQIRGSGEGGGWGKGRGTRKEQEEEGGKKEG